MAEQEIVRTYHTYIYTPI